MTAPAPPLTSADTIRAATYARMSLAERKAAEDGATIIDAHGVLNQGTITEEHAAAKGWQVADHTATATTMSRPAAARTTAPSTGG